MTGTRPRPETTLAVLLGAKEWPQCEAIARNPGVIFERSCHRVRDYLLDPCGFKLPAANLLDLFDVPDPQSALCEKITTFLRDRTKQAAERASPTDLLIYYVGHGDRDPDGNYYLLVRSSRAQTLISSGLNLDGVAELLKEDARHLRHYLILDACMSGKARNAGWKSPRGVALLCSSSDRLPSRAPAGGKYTLFTGALIEALTQPAPGDEARRDESLSLRDICTRARRQIDKEREKAVVPEIHSPIQVEELAELPFFLRPAPPPPPTPDTELKEHKIQVLENYRIDLQRRLDTSEFWTGLYRIGVIAGAIAFGIYVWPTLYRQEKDIMGKVVENRRVNRLTGQNQIYDAASEQWKDMNDARLGATKFDPDPLGEYFRKDHTTVSPFGPRPSGVVGSLSDALVKQGAKKPDDNLDLLTHGKIATLKSELLLETDPIKRAKLCDELRRLAGIRKNPFTGELYLKEIEDVCGLLKWPLTPPAVVLPPSPAPP